jgi:hypothetical protein
MEEKSSLALTELVRMFRADLRTIASASTTALSYSVSSTTCAMRAQLSRLRADCGVSCAKRSSERLAAALKSCTMSGAGGDWASGGEWITVTRGRGSEEALEVPVPVAVLFVDGLVLVLVLVRRMRVMPARVRRCCIALNRVSQSARFGSEEAAIGRSTPLCFDDFDK